MITGHTSELSNVFSIYCVGYCLCLREMTMYSICFNQYTYQKRIIFSLIFVTALFPSCATVDLPGHSAKTDVLVAITAAPTNTYHQGKFVWHDLLTPDIFASRKFYSELFNWSFEQQGRYSVILNDGQRIGGMLEVKPKTGKQVEALWLAYLSVPDVDTASSYIESQGGQVLQGPVDMLQRGRGALVSDAQGAQFLLLHSLGGDPADNEPVIGAWLWNELWSNQAETSLNFYQHLGNYDHVIEYDHYQILQSKGRWRAGIRQVSDKEFKARWVSSIRVADPAQLLEKVERLGGRVWIRPGESLADPEANIALISDNAGAFLILHRWPGSFESGEQ